MTGSEKCYQEESSRGYRGMRDATLERMVREGLLKGETFAKTQVKEYWELRRHLEKSIQGTGDVRGQTLVGDTRLVRLATQGLMYGWKRGSDKERCGKRRQRGG